MPIYHYTAKDRKGAKSDGFLEAATPSQVASILHSYDFVPIRISEKMNTSVIGDIFSRFSRVKLQDLAALTQQLSAMISAGVPLTDSLRSMSEQTQSRPLRKALAGVVSDVEGGATLANAMARFPNIFSEVYVALIRAGETAGVLDKVMDKLAQALNKQKEFVAKTKGALLYPVIILVILVIVMTIMLVFVIPKMIGIYKEMDVELPLPTIILIAISDFTTKFWFLLPFGAFSFIFVFSRIRRTQTGKEAIDGFFLKIPVWGKLAKAIILTNFARTLSLLVATGIPILEALRVVRGVVGNSLFVLAIDDTIKKVEQGVSLFQPLSQNPLFPPLVSEMIRVGEETGKLDETLEKLAMYFEEDADQLVRNLTTALEPIIIILIGAGVGFLVLSVILPIYRLSTAI